MTTITGFKFDTAAGAAEMVILVNDPVNQQLITLQDAAIVTWPEGKKHPMTRHLVGLAGEDALDDAFWGLLFGLIFFVPSLGMAFSSAMGSLVGHFSKYGIDRGFIKLVQEEVTEGTSVLFLVINEAVPDGVIKLIEESGLNVELFFTNLSEEQETRLRGDFAG